MPKLVSDPVLAESAPDKYVITMDGASVDSSPEVLGDGSVRLAHDLSGVTPGPHTGDVKAVNGWGESLATPFAFTSEPPASPSNVHIEF